MEVTDRYNDMKKYGRDLEFISLVKRDGSGTIRVGTAWDTASDHPKTDDVRYMDGDLFELKSLSLSNKTFIATGMNTWVVRLRPTKSADQDSGFFNKDGVALRIADVLDSLPTDRINRVEVVDEHGRSYVNKKPANYGRVRLELQDEGRTLKVFITSQTTDIRPEISEHEI